MRGYASPEDPIGNGVPNYNGEVGGMSDCLFIRMNDRPEGPIDEKLRLDRRRILLIADNRQELSSLSAFLIRAGAWDVWQADTCHRADQLWTEHQEQVDLIITDISLADGSGIDLLERFREQKPSCYRVVLGSLPAVADDFECDASLLKPFRKGDLIAIINEL